MGYFSHMVVINAICDILVSAEISGSYSYLIMVGYKWEMKDTPTNHNHIQKKLEGNSQTCLFFFPTDESFFKIPPQHLESICCPTAGGSGGRVRLRPHHCRAFMRSHMRGGSNRRSSLRLAPSELRLVDHATGGEQGVEEEST